MRAQVLRAVAAATLTLAALAGCGSESEGPAATDTESSVDAEPELVDGGEEAEEEAEEEAQAGEGVCPDDATAVDVPAEFTDVPFPDGAVVYDVETRDGTGTILTAATAQPLSEVLAAMDAAYTTNGYQITDGETEDLDAEANWTNAEGRGRWAIRDLTGSCESGTQVQVLVGE